MMKSKISKDEATSIILQKHDKLNKKDISALKSFISNSNYVMIFPIDKLTLETDLGITLESKTESRNISCLIIDNESIYFGIVDTSYGKVKEIQLKDFCNIIDNIIDCNIEPLYTYNVGITEIGNVLISTKG